MIQLPTVMEVVFGRAVGDWQPMRLETSITLPAMATLMSIQVAWTTATRFKSSDRKSTRLNSSHLGISYAVFCLKKKTKKNKRTMSAETIWNTTHGPLGAVTR